MPEPGFPADDQPVGYEIGHGLPKRSIPGVLIGVDHKVTKEVLKTWIRKKQVL